MHKTTSNRVLAVLCLGLSFCVVACADDEGSATSATGTDGTTGDTGGPYPFAPSDDSLAAEESTSYELSTDFEFKASFDYATVAGWPAAADLSVALPGEEAVFQVFTDGERPFARAGLKLTALEAGTDYELAITKDQILVTNEAGDIVLEQSIALDDASKLVLSTPNPELYAAPIDLKSVTVE